MKKMFVDSLRKLMAEMQIQSGKQYHLRTSIIETYGKDLHYSQLTRLPDYAVKTMLKIPCPISHLNSTQQIYKEMRIFKRLRGFYGIDQKSNCVKCPFAQSCKLNGKPFRELSAEHQHLTFSLQDFLTFFLALQKQSQSNISEIRWSSAYKTIKSMTIMLRDFDILRAESFLYKSVFKSFKLKEDKQLKKYKSEEDIKNQEISKRLKQRRLRIDGEVIKPQKKINQQTQQN